MTRIACYLAGDSYPRDAHVERALQPRLGAVFGKWIGQAAILSATGEAAFRTDVARRVSLLERLVPPGGSARRTVLIGRSSGARVASLFAVQRAVAAVICLGYPFREPGRVLEPERFAPLAVIAVPTLIVQGVADPYGGVELTEHYALSASVRLHFVPGGHEFDHAPQAWDALAAAIAAFCERAGAVSPSSPPEFDEAFYLRANPDVAAAVARGAFGSGAEHFAKHGRRERRSFRLLPPTGARG